ncbi:conserved hypothetical protein [Alteromonas infernus]
MAHMNPVIKNVIYSNRMRAASVITASSINLNLFVMAWNFRSKHAVYLNLIERDST